MATTEIYYEQVDRVSGPAPGDIGVKPLGHEVLAWSSHRRTASWPQTAVSPLTNATILPSPTRFQRQYCRPALPGRSERRSALERRLRNPSIEIIKLCRWVWFIESVCAASPTSLRPRTSTVGIRPATSAFASETTSTTPSSVRPRTSRPGTTATRNFPRGSEQGHASLPSRTDQIRDRPGAWDQDEDDPLRKEIVTEFHHQPLAYLCNDRAVGLHNHLEMAEDG